MYQVHVVPVQDWPEFGIGKKNHCSCLGAIITRVKTGLGILKFHNEYQVNITRKHIGTIKQSQMNEPFRLVTLYI